MFNNLIKTILDFFKKEVPYSEEACPCSECRGVCSCSEEDELILGEEDSIPKGCVDKLKSSAKLVKDSPDSGLVVLDTADDECVSDFLLNFNPAAVILNKTLLRKEYVTNKMSILSISKKYKRSKNTISKLLKQFNIPIKTTSKKVTKRKSSTKSK